MKTKAQIAIEILIKMKEKKIENFISENKQVLEKLFSLNRELIELKKRANNN